MDPSQLDPGFFQYLYHTPDLFSPIFSFCGEAPNCR